MKSLQHIIEGLLDSDFDINLISVAELVERVFGQRQTKKQWDELAKTIDRSFEPADSSDCAQDYFGTIEVFPNEREIHIRFKPPGTYARDFGVQMNSMEIKKGKIKYDRDGCHWLMKPAYQIPETRENECYLQEVNEAHVKKK